VAPLEGSGAPEKAYTLATQAYCEELEKVPVAGVVTILREEGTNEQGRVRALKVRPRILSVGNTLSLGQPEYKIALDDLIWADDVVFAATGVTSGETLRGVEYFRGGARANTVVMSTKPRVVRFMNTIHVLEPKSGCRVSRFEVHRASTNSSIVAFVNREESRR
jgi:fructose-1,6-bisphosphatase/sedoheptulose 1,7-bisphosphatase-like protein